MHTKANTHMYTLNKRTHAHNASTYMYTLNKHTHAHNASTHMHTKTNTHIQSHKIHIL